MMQPFFVINSILLVDGDNLLIVVEVVEVQYELSVVGVCGDLHVPHHDHVAKEREEIWVGVRDSAWQRFIVVHSERDENLNSEWGVRGGDRTRGDDGEGFYKSGINVTKWIFILWKLLAASIWKLLTMLTLN